MSTSQKRTLELIGKVLAGLQVPLSMKAPLGAAEEPYRQLRDELNVFGWPTAEEFEAFVRAKLYTDESMPKETEDRIVMEGLSVLDAFGITTKGELDDWPEVREQSVRLVITLGLRPEASSYNLLVRAAGTFVRVYSWFPRLGETTFTYRTTYETKR